MNFHRSRTRELPGNYPFSVKENLIRESTKKWKALADGCFLEVERILNEHVMYILEDHFVPYAHGGLLDELRYLIRLVF